jgi:hypothetical protein
MDEDANTGAHPPAPVWLSVGFWICTVIAVAVVLRRVIAFVQPAHSAPPQLAQLDAIFASHMALTLLHILPALAFVVLTPLALRQHSATSLWAERFLYPLGAIVGLTAYAMSADAIGGWIERSAVLLFNTVFLLSLGIAYRARQNGDTSVKQKWLLRAVGILLGIATTRPVMGIFFATSPLTHLQHSQFFGIAFWIGFSINTLVVEWWLRSGWRDRRADGIVGVASGTSHPH